ncbi:MAG: peptidyl-prolyl cis-trans isomerase [Thainema sp.]
MPTSSTMSDLQNLPFLSIDDQTLSLGQVLQYLQVSGKLLPFLQEIVGQHVIYQEIQARQDLEVSASQFEQAIIDFRIQRQLTDMETFQKWLAQQGMNYESFQRLVLLNLKLDQLKTKIAEPDLETYFTEQQQNLDVIDLSCLTTTKQAEAEICYQQLTTGTANFDQLVQASQSDDSSLSVLRGPTRRQQLPDGLEQQVNTATIGQWIGPVEIANHRWCIFRVEHIKSAVLDGAVKKDLENRLFQRWLTERVKTMTVQLALGQPKTE